MKTLVIIILTLSTTILIGKSIFAPSAQAESADTAYNALARTENDLRKTVASTAAQARRLQDRLGSEDRHTALPKDVEEFLATTRRLEALRRAPRGARGLKPTHRL
jgi:hypothetical protein